MNEMNQGKNDIIKSNPIWTLRLLNNWWYVSSNYIGTKMRLELALCMKSDQQRQKKNNLDVLFKILGDLYFLLQPSF